MPKIGLRHMLLAMVIGLSGCSYLGLSDDDDSIAAGTDLTEAPKVSVQRIENLELGRLFDGFMLSAVAIAPGTGYYEPELRVRYGGQLGPDGFFEYDFVARAPDDPSTGANAPITARYIRADTELSTDMLRAARGVRIWSERDSVEGRF